YTDIEKIKSKGPVYMQAMNRLTEWNGEYDVQSTGATIYTSMLYHILKLAMEDELGEDQFKKTVNSVTLRSSIETLFFNEDSPWWDNINTEEKESRNQLFREGLQLAMDDLSENIGESPDNWHWGKLHTLTHVHPVGRQEPFDKVFNVGPFAKSGGNEVVDKENFLYSGHGPYNIRSGPAMRLLLDFARPEEALSVIPTGQSGNVMSRHYDDQAVLFVQGKYKVQEMDKSKLPADRILHLKPGL
ncbi:MAG: penicillin acylase family protein, partial [Bacteroidetes bacterium]